MDRFKIGDKIIYPNQGFGIIEDIQIEKYYGQEFKVYHIKIIANDTLVLVPSSSLQEIGIRKPISENSINDVFELMKNGEVDVTMNWKGRYKEHLDLMKTGQIQDLAIVLKSLYYLNKIKPLSFREKNMMEKAKELFVTELSEVSSLSSEEIEKKLFDHLSCCFKEGTSNIDS